MEVVVDNSAGVDSAFAAEVADRLRQRGVNVRVRDPDPSAMFDTAVHMISAGLAIRVAERPDAELLTAIEDVVREGLVRHPILRRRAREVPVYLGESARVLAWIDAFA
jgi:hypothetical protein